MLPSAESIQIIVPVASIALLVMSLKNPVYGVIAYFVVLNAKLGDMYPVLGAVRFELIVALFVMVRILFSTRGHGNFLPRVNPINTALWLLFAVGMISVAFSLFPGVSWNEGGYFLLKMTIFYIMIVTTVHTSADLSRILWAFILITAWIAYEPVVNYISGNVDEQLYGAVAVGRFGAFLQGLDQRRAVLSFDRYIVHSDRTLQRLLGLGVASEKIIHLPHPPLELDAPIPLPVVPKDGDRRDILFFGNIKPYKGVETLIEAGIALAATRRDFRITIAGRPSHPLDALRART